MGMADTVTKEYMRGNKYLQMHLTILFMMASRLSSQRFCKNLIQRKLRYRLHWMKTKVQLKMLFRNIVMY